MSRVFAACTVVFLVATVSATANAEGFGVGARVAVVQDDGTDNTRGMPGLFLRMGDGVFGVEGTIDYKSDDVGPVDIRTWPVTVSVLVRPLPIVFAGAGLGWYNTTFDYNDPLIENTTESEIGYQLGAGVELPLTPQFELVGDLRYHFIDYDVTEDVSEFDFDNANYFSVHGGILFNIP
ncbi:MAG: outer membrane beta-barrel protein [candidate division Zixibacteria bacterium]|nr:outer membrane beta-barrel protein [candidate division Zixibacteria bacterium]